MILIYNILSMNIQSNDMAKSFYYILKIFYVHYMRYFYNMIE